MTHTPLIPTPRTDKNGRTVIRHMKPQDAARTTSKKLETAAPVIAAQTYEQLLNETVGHLCELVTVRYPLPEDVETFRQTALKFFHRFSPATLRRINEHPWNPKYVSNFVLKVESLQWYDYEHRTNDYLASIDTLIPLQTYAEWAILGLDEYSGLCPQGENGDYPEERGQQINALFTVMGHLIDHGVSARDYSLHNDPIKHFIQDEKLSSFIITPGDGYSRNEIVDLITTRNITDVDHIKELLGTEESALRSGAL